MDVAATASCCSGAVGAIQRIAMVVVELPQEQRERHYALVRRNFEAAITELGIEGATAHAWSNSTMIGAVAGRRN